MTRRRTVLLLAIAAAACSRSEPTQPAGRPPANALTFRISYGSEKKAFLTDSVEAFHRTNPRTSGERPIRVEALAEGSAESMESLLAGRTDVAAWSPASSLLVDVINDRWVEAKGTLGGGKKLVESAPPLVLSPVVLAVWEPMARAMGWPDKPIGWSDVARFATEEAGWSRYGHPEWGAFKFGHTHPRYSNSGAIALVAATYAGAGKTRDLGDGDVRKSTPFVKQVQAGVVHYGRSTGFFAEKMFSRGPAYLSAAVLYENLVVEHREGALAEGSGGAVRAAPSHHRRRAEGHGHAGVGAGHRRGEGEAGGVVSRRRGRPQPAGRGVVAGPRQQPDPARGRAGARAAGPHAAGDDRLGGAREGAGARRQR